MTDLIVLFRVQCNFLMVLLIGNYKRLMTLFCCARISSSTVHAS